MKNIVTCITVAILATSCLSDKNDPEEAARPTLNAARAELIRKNYQAARDSIKHLRKAYPTAFQTRTAALLLMDSVELAEARDSLTLLDAQLQKERERLDSVKALPDALKKDEYYNQKNKVYNMEQHLDEVAAKVKFFIRKIDIDNRKISAANT